MAEERMRVLDMVREGKISAEEGARLLEALRGSGSGGGAGRNGGPSGRDGEGGGAGGAGSGAWPGGTDPIGTMAGSIASSVAELLQKSGFSGWASRGGWSSGPLRGGERRREREAEGWEPVALSDGDHGTFELPDGASLTVEAEAGGIHARAVESGPARLTLEGDDLANFAVYAVRKGQEVTLSSYRTEHFARLPRLVLDVPAGVGRVSLHTSGGNLKASAFACPVTLHTSGGGIHVEEQGTGTVAAKTSGGNIAVDGRPGAVELKTSGGGIRFRGHTEAFQAQTSGGSISIEGARLTGGEHRAKTAGGSIRVRLTRDSSVDLSAQTSAGHLSLELPGMRGEQSGARMSPRYRGTFNGGGARLDLTTAAGSVTVGLAEDGSREPGPAESDAAGSDIPAATPESPAESAGPRDVI